MHYMFITTTTWIEIFICSMNNFLYNIIVNISTLRINSNSNTYLKFSFHTLFFFKFNWIIVPRKFSSDEFLDAAFWNVRKTTILFILKANWCHPLFTKSERLFLKKHILGQFHLPQSKPCIFFLFHIMATLCVYILANIT